MEIYPRRLRENLCSVSDAMRDLGELVNFRALLHGGDIAFVSTDQVRELRRVRNRTESSRTVVAIA